MSNLAQSLKAEIQRISRRELKASVSPIRASTIVLKKTVANLEKRIAVLEPIKSVFSQLRHPLRTSRSRQKLQGKSGSQRRASERSETSFGLSQADFGKLIGVSSQNVFVMEHKEGRLNVRKKTVASLLAIKGLGRREAKNRL